MDSNAPAAFELDHLPGHAIRRLHQISVGIFLQETQAHGVTPVQFAALQTVCNQPLVDQRTLARLIALDTSTTAGVVDRLQARGWLQRSLSPHDRRVRLLSITPEGEAQLRQIQPAVAQAQQLILAPLSPEQQQTFMALLDQLVQANNAFSRAPSEVCASA
jgi:MarR family transcriptional regulator, lower aerobic nicotinate degradation pathway regulator